MNLAYLTLSFASFVVVVLALFALAEVDDSPALYFRAALFLRLLCASAFVAAFVSAGVFLFLSIP